jgi:hypothetical protein
VVICKVGLAAAAAMMILNPWLALSGDVPESFTDTLNEKVPAWVGVPEIAPLLLSVDPAGRLPEETDQL